MGLLDGVLGQLGGDQKGGLGDIIALAMKNPAALTALGSLLSSRDTSVGGPGGLGGLLTQFQKHGLGDLVNGWIAQGPNPGISPSQVGDVLGAGTIAQFAGKAGVSATEAQSMLAGLLPTAVDQLTPDGTLPDAATLDEKIASLMGRLGR